MPPLCSLYLRNWAWCFNSTGGLRQAPDHEPAGALVLKGEGTAARVPPRRIRSAPANPERTRRPRAAAASARNWR